jgi:hypothetical protein
VPQVVYGLILIQDFNTNLLVLMHGDNRSPLANRFRTGEIGRTQRDLGEKAALQRGRFALIGLNSCLFGAIIGEENGSNGFIVEK